MCPKIGTTTTRVIFGRPPFDEFDKDHVWLIEKSDDRDTESLREKTHDRDNFCQKR